MIRILILSVFVHSLLNQVFCQPQELWSTISTYVSVDFTQQIDTNQPDRIKSAKIDLSLSPTKRSDDHKLFSVETLILSSKESSHPQADIFLISKDKHSLEIHVPIRKEEKSSPLAPAIRFIKKFAPKKRSAHSHDLFRTTPLLVARIKF